MIHKKTLLALIACTLLHAEKDIHSVAHLEYPNTVSIEKAFSHPKLALSVRQQAQIQKLLHTIKKSSLLKQIEAAQEAASILDQEIEQRRLIYETADKQDKDFIGYKAGILIAQSYWLKQIAKKMRGCLPIHKQASQFCKRYFKQAKRKAAQLFNYPPSHINLTDQLLAYAQLEREYIFSTYPSTVAHAVINEHKDLPELIKFWGSHRQQWVLLNQSKKYLYQPRVQAGDLFEAAGTAAVQEASAAIADATEEITANIEEEAASGAIAGVTKAGAEEAAEGSSDLADEAVSGDQSEQQIEEAEEAIIEGTAKENIATEELTNPEEIQGLLNKTASALKAGWTKAGDVAEDGANVIKGVWEKVPGHSIIDAVTGTGTRLVMGPIRGMWKLVGEFLPESTSMEELAGSMAEGSLTAADLTPEAIEDAGNTVSDYAAQGKQLSSRLAKKGFGRLFAKRVTSEEIEQLSTQATDDDLAGALRTQIAQMRGQAAAILEDEGPQTVLGKAMRWLRGPRAIAGKGLRALDSSSGAELSQAANALRLSEAGLDGAGEVSEETAQLMEEVKALRRELTTPLTKSGRYLRMLGNMNRALAVNYPLIHMTLEMTLFMDMMMGGQLAIAWEDQAQAEQYIAMTQQRNQISAAFQSELSEIELTQEASMRQLRANKAKMLLGIAKINQQLSTSTVQEINYIVQSIAGTTPQHIYLSEPMMYDQYFYYSPMLTPNSNEPLFPPQNENSPWAIKPTKPPVLKQLTAGWIVEQSQSNTPTDQGTGAWVVGGKPPEQPAEPIIFTKQFTIPTAFPTNPVAHTWYNPFRAGNWIFNPDENAFIQYLMQPITSNSAPQGDADSALQNSIFTEYIPPIILNEDGVMTYIVQVEMKLYNAQFPFFAGIYFNGGRWISGSSDLRKQHRLFGLYGTPDQKISLYATETAYISAKNQLLEKTSLTALEQVFASSETKKEWISKYRALIPNPLYPNAKENAVPLEIGKTYILTAATQPTRIMLKLEEKTEQGVVPIFGPYTIINRNPFIFVYHNIGFISGGCSAGFRLIKPQQLAYTPKMLEQFKKDIGLSEPSEMDRS